jgi:ribosome maturation factor RimP
MGSKSPEYHAFCLEVAQKVDDMGYYLVDISVPKNNVIQVFIDTVPIQERSGISLKDCMKVSNELDLLVELFDLLDGPYEFQVSSPGVFRALKTANDWVWALKKSIRVQTQKGKNIEGKLIRYDVENNSCVVLTASGDNMRFDCSTVRANANPKLRN